MPSFGALAKFHILVSFIAILVYYFNPEILSSIKSLYSTLLNDSPADIVSPDANSKLFTVEELTKYDSNVNENEIYLSILGSVYDVTKGKKHYGRGCSYGFFTGKDASASFITGEFEHFTSESDDVAQLKPADILSLLNWKKFYDEQYVFKGKLIGRFYDANGKPTSYYKKVEALAELGSQEKQKARQLKELFPPCNIEWSAESGTRVWCTKESGGIRREWIGVPRKYYEPGQTSFRCVCVNKKDLQSPHLKPYETCDDIATECFYNVD